MNQLLLMVVSKDRLGPLGMTVDLPAGGREAAKLIPRDKIGRESVAARLRREAEEAEGKRDGSRKAGE